MSKSAKTVAWLGASLLFVGLVAAWIALAPYFWTNVWWFIRASLWFTIPAIVLFVMFVAMYVHVTWRSDGGRPTVWFIVGYVLLAALGLGTLICWAAARTYMQDRHYLASVTVVDGGVPGFGQRAPYQVAQAQARPNLGDNPGDIADTSYLADRDTYSTLVQRRGMFEGYATILTQAIPLTGRGSGKTCEFSPQADRRIDGNFSGNLGRLIGTQKRWLNFYDEDAYGYCDGDTPMVVVPLIEQDGWLVVTQRPAGIALYNGKTGAVEFRDDTTGIPGPAYSMILAGMQRQATHAIEGFDAWFWNRAGWETTEGDDDTNSGNAAEFNLKADKPTYVTPLTGRGSATSISAISAIPVNGNATRLAPLTVHRLNPNWVSPSAIVSRIKADYQDIPNWQNIKVMELAPTTAGRWVATLGNDQNVLYRAEGTGDLQGDAPTCLLRADGTQIRCGTVADRNGNGVGTKYGPADTAIPSDLGALTPQQLGDLQRRLSEEVQRRLEGR